MKQAVDLINRIRKLKEFEVQIEVPSVFQFRGTIPFDLEIIGPMAYVKVYATSIEEARTQVHEYFHRTYDD